DVSLSESGDTADEAFTVRLTDTHGVLSASNAGGGSVSAAGTTLIITGTLAQVNAALATLSDTDGTTGADTIDVNATDSFGNVASEQQIAVSVAAGPVLAAPANAAVGLGEAGAIAGVSLSETGGTTGETFTVTLGDSNGLLSASNAGGATVTGGGTGSLSISGTLSEVNAALATLADTDSVGSSDTITVNASDSFGNTAGSKTIAVTVNGLPSIAAPTAVTAGLGQAAAVAGISLSESGNTTGETFTVTLSDTDGVLSASNAGGATVSAAGTTLTIQGTLGQVNVALATLTDTDTTAGSDTIAIDAADGFGNAAVEKTTAVTVNGLPVVAAPATLALGVGKPGGISGVSLSESGNTGSESFTVTLNDTHGVLSATSTGGAVVSGGGTTLTISGSFAQVNATLATLSDSDGTIGPDTIDVTATDSFGNSASEQQIAVSVAAGPVIAAPGSAKLGVGQASGVAGISLSESGAVRGETFTVTLSDTHGTLSASNAGGATVGAAGTTLTIGGTLDEVNAALATLSDTDASTAADSIAINATDSFGNDAGSKTVAVTVNGLPSVTAPASASVGVNHASAISGVSLSESGSMDGETFTVTLTDTNGALSASNVGGAAVAGAGTTSLTISGSLTAVNTALGTLTDTDAVAAADIIDVNAVDGFGNSAGEKQIAVTVTSGPVIAAPAGVTLGVGQAATISGVSVSEGGDSSGSFTVTVSDTNGALSASGAGGATMTGGGTNVLSISGSLSQVNAALASLGDTDATAGTDGIVLNAIDGFGNPATQATIAVTVNSDPVVTAGAATTIGVGQAAAIAGASLSESGDTSGETFTVTVADTDGALSVSGAGGGAVTGNGSNSLLINGTLSQLYVALATP